MVEILRITYFAYYVLLVTNSKYAVLAVKQKRLKLVPVKAKMYFMLESSAFVERLLGRFLAK